MDAPLAREEADAAMREFVLRFLQLEGIPVRRRNNHVYTARLTDDWQERLKRKSIRFTFHRQTACEHADVELIAYGSPLFETFVDVLKESSRWMRLYAPVGFRWSRRGRIDQLEFLGFSPVVKPQKPVYACYLTFNFVISYSGVEVGKEMVRLFYDPLVEKVFDSPSKVFAPSTLQRGRAQSIGLDLKQDDLDRIFGLCTKKLRRDLRREVVRLQETSRKALDEESMRLSRYYQDMIWEEKERDLRYKSTERIYPDSVGERTRELKLEWERRLALEGKRLLPAVLVSLVGIELCGVPVKRILIHAAGAEDIDPATALFNLNDGSFLAPMCPICRKRSRVLAVANERRLIVCKSCFANPKECDTVSG